MKTTLFKKIIAAILSTALICSLLFSNTYSAWVEQEILPISSIESTPSYRLINTYDSETNIIQSDIYVSGGYGSSGMIGLYYNTELLSFAVETDEGIVPYSGYDSGLNDYYYIRKLFSPLAYASTNRVSDLINEKDGELFFEWYTNNYIFAQKEDKCIATAYFIVKDEVSKADLEYAGNELISFALDVPTNTNVIGYNSGVMIANEKNNYFRYGMNGKPFNGTTKQLAVSIEYRGLDIDPFFNTNFKANNNGIRFCALPNGSQFVAGVSAGTDPLFVKNMFFRSSDYTIEIFEKDKVTVPTKITTDCVVTIKDVDGNKTEFPIVVTYDVNGDGIVNMSDVSTAMVFLKDSDDAVRNCSYYAVDTNYDEVISAGEIQILLAQLIK